MANEKLPRLIRIIGKPGNTVGRFLTVTDAVTDETIQGVKSIMLHLSVCDTNTASVTYYKKDGKGQFVLDENKNPITQTDIVEVAEVDITAEDWGNQ